MSNSKLKFEIYPPNDHEYTAKEEWIQFMTVALWFSIALSLVLGVPIMIPIVFYIYPLTRAPIIGYIAWIILDWKDGPTKGRDNPWLIKNFRFNSIWKHFQQYFNGRLVKTAELDPKHRYIFGIHPHGLYAVSMFANMWQNNDFKLAFKGINLIGSTLPSNFWIPVWRDYVLAVGCASSSKESIKYRLTNGPPGTALTLAVGGAREFKYMEEGVMDLVLLQRKGFVKIALETGAHLVPVLSFGENDLFTLVKNDFTEPIDGIFRKVFNASAPIVVGKNWGLPARKTLVTVGNYINKSGSPLLSIKQRILQNKNWTLCTKLI